jgi:hypothetical protein
VQVIDLGREKYET